MTAKTTAIIKNKKGIHIRPSGVIYSEIAACHGKVSLRTDKKVIPVESAVDILSLGLLRGTSVEIIVKGRRARDTAHRIKKAFEHEYDFP